jgi:hypothetical protein
MGEVEPSSLFERHCDRCVEYRLNPSNGGAIGDVPR